jgi:hypothetical protein
MFQGLRSKNDTSRMPMGLGKVIDQPHAWHRPFGATYGGGAMQKFDSTVD